MSFPSESDMMSKELQNSDLIYVDLLTNVFKIIVKYRWKIIAKYRHLSPSGNRALAKNRRIVRITPGVFCNKRLLKISLNSQEKHQHWSLFLLEL